MTAARAIAVHLVCGAACAERAPIVELPAPVRDGTFVLTIDGRQDWVGTREAPVRIEEAEYASFDLALYAEAPHALGLSLGALADAPRACRSCGLLQPLATYRQSPAPGGAWTPTAGLDEALAARLVPDAWPECSCTHFEPSTLPVPLALGVTIVSAMRDADGSVLLAANDGSIARVRADRTSSLVCGPSSLLRDASLGEPGRLWIARATEVAELVLADQRPDAPCRTETPTTTTELVGAQVAAISAMPGWLLVAAGNGVVYEYDGRFRRLGVLPDSRSFDVRVLGHRTAFAAGPSAASTFWIQGGVARAESLSPNDDVGGIALSPVLGPLVGLEVGGIQVREGGAWVPAGFADSSAASAILPWGDHVVAALHGGIPAELLRGPRSCPVLGAFSPELVYELAQLGEDTVVFADIISDERVPSAVGLLRATPWCAN